MRSLVWHRGVVIVHELIPRGSAWQRMLAFVESSRGVKGQAWAVDLDAVCRSFDLGVLSRPAEPLAGGSSEARWKVHTSRGRWMVKAVGSPASWQLNQMRVSGIVERAAYAAGVPVPRPVEPSGAAAGYWARLGERDLYARASRWVDGTPPGWLAGAELAGWLGRTLAAIEGLALPGDPVAEAAYPVHSVADWPSWLDQAMAAGVLGPRLKGAALAAVTQATALVEAALAAGPAFLLAHRDASVRNILITDRGPVLLDFDYAGPEVPWWEFVHHCFDLASPCLGRQPPRPDMVRAALAAYTHAGGVAGPRGPEAFAGLLRAALGSLAYDIWLAVGHRPASSARRAAAARDAQELAIALPSILNSLGPWGRLIS